MYTSMLSFPASVFSDFDHLRRELEDVFGLAGGPSGIRSVAPGAFPALNVGHTPSSVEIYAFAPGVDASKVEVNLDRGVLTISGERPAALPADSGSGSGSGSDNGNGHGNGERVTAYSRERTFGRFRRAINLPEDVDPERVQATYRNGVLHISVARREAPQPRRITIQ